MNQRVKIVKKINNLSKCVQIIVFKLALWGLDPEFEHKRKLRRYVSVSIPSITSLIEVTKELEGGGVGYRVLNIGLSGLPREMGLKLLESSGLRKLKQDSELPIRIA